MCGIVGLFLKNKAMEPMLGDMLSKMLVTLSARGPDSAGVAIYGGRDGDNVKLTLRTADGSSVAEVAEELSAVLHQRVVAIRSNHIVLSVARNQETSVLTWLKAHRPDLQIVSAGTNMEIYKDVGLPEHVVSEFGLAGMQGTHGIGHTRMATKSAVTIDGAHPFSTGEDQCLVHNGSLSNHNAMRRNLQARRHGVSPPRTTPRSRPAISPGGCASGDSLKQALTASLNDLDGFFTFVVGTRTGFAVLRDPIACKPAVMAETDDYVAFGSEYRALVGTARRSRTRGCSSPNPPPSMPGNVP